MDPAQLKMAAAMMKNMSPEGEHAALRLMSLGGHAAEEAHLKQLGVPCMLCIEGIVWLHNTWQHACSFPIGLYDPFHCAPLCVPMQTWSA